MNDDKIFQSEELIYNVTEDLLILMEEKGISKNDLANELNKSKAYVSQVLSGSRNMTLNTLSDICFALKVKPVVNIPIDNARNLLEEDTFVGTPIKRAEKVIEMRKNNFWEGRTVSSQEPQSQRATKKTLTKVSGEGHYSDWGVAV